jgi:NADPH:quinone reductase-like Zn-dependent oxidoreductase
MASAGKAWLTVGLLASALGLSIKHFATTTRSGIMPPTFAELRVKHETVSLIGKEAIVVGGTSGIGMGIALRLAEAGAAVTIVGRDRTRAAQIVEQMNSAAPDGTAAQYVLTFQLHIPCQLSHSSGID